MIEMTVVTRFAPSPTGDLHLGHAYSAWFARDFAVRSGGRFLVRIEDIDAGRCRPTFIDRNLEDLLWLGLTWDGPVIRQSQRMDLYRRALDRLDELGVTYPCFCTRKEIQAEIEAAAGAPHAAAPDGSLLYPGTCKAVEPAKRNNRIAAGLPYALRLDNDRARHLTGALTWTDQSQSRRTAASDRFGDVVIARKDVATSYHLAVVVDDAAQGVTHVTRGEDLREATHVHRLLYALLEEPPPAWRHHPLCLDDRGRRLSKRRGSETIRALRERGYTPDEVINMAKAALAAPSP
jgi:glutamyl-Q tRNA(Asp) synthetase